MALPAHPEAAYEALKLTDTLALIEREQGVAEREREGALQALAAARADDPDHVPVREQLYAASLDAIARLARSRLSPYFTRVDFVPVGGAPETHYIGRTGVLDTRTLEAAVIDWRAPVANLYYSGQLGAVSYEAPDGRVEGELRLKRQLTVKDGRLEAIFDTDLVSRDQFLQSVLGAMASDRLKEIVTTIQAEQNYVIRYPLGSSLIVQGVAGSGKTTIALHRIAYLLYAFDRQIRPEQMLILAPNPLFLSFISGVLPDLGVERVKQGTFLQLMRDWLGRKMPRVDARDRTEHMAGLPADEYERLRGIYQFKGSLELFKRLEAWLADYEASFARGAIDFGPVRLYDEAELRQFLLVDEKPFPMERRLMEFKKPLTARAKAAARRLAQWMEAECDKRLERMIVAERDPAALAARRAQLVSSRDARIREVRDRVAPFVRDRLKGMPSLEPVECYRLFLESLLPEADGSAARAAARHTLGRLEAGRPLEPEDVAPVALIAHRLTVTERGAFRHVVADEAQDFSALEFMLLTRYAPMASLTVVGDLMQGVQSFRGLNDWAVLKEQVFGGRAALHRLLTSYRSTVEIMEVAFKVAARHPAPGQQGALPVLRHGEPVQFERFETDARQAHLVAEIARTWKAEGCGSIAVVARGAGGLPGLLKRLPPEMNARLLDVEASDYEPGVLLCSAGAAKGFEFDGVILADAGALAFGDDPPSAKLLYVALTRALHRLAVLYRKEMSPLLGGKQ